LKLSGGREVGGSSQLEPPLMGEEKGNGREKKNRGEGEMEFSQGLMRNSRKLQGPLCKVKFLINLKP
jgi:hypothetical protein